MKRMTAGVVAGAVVVCLVWLTRSYVFVSNPTAADNRNDQGAWSLDVHRHGKVFGAVREWRMDEIAKGKRVGGHPTGLSDAHAHMDAVSEDVWHNFFFFSALKKQRWRAEQAELKAKAAANAPTVRSVSAIRNSANNNAPGVQGAISLVEKPPSSVPVGGGTASAATSSGLCQPDFRSTGRIKSLVAPYRTVQFFTYQAFVRGEKLVILGGSEDFDNVNARHSESRAPMDYTFHRERTPLCVVPGVSKPLPAIIEYGNYVHTVTCDFPAALAHPWRPHDHVFFTDTQGSFNLSVPVCLGAPPAPARKVVACTQPLHSNISRAAVREWLAYHLLVGVQHFYMYDRFDALGDLLAPFERAGVVTRTVWPPYDDEYAREPLVRVKPSFDQTPAMDHCLWRAKHHRDEWTLFIDLDEFLHHQPHAESTRRILAQLLESNQNRASLRLWMVLYGGLAQPSPPQSPLLARYVYVPVRSGNGNSKAIVHTSRVDHMSVHYVLPRTLLTPPHSLQLDRHKQLRINHFHRSCANITNCRFRESGPRLLMTLRDADMLWALEPIKAVLAQIDASQYRVNL